MDSNPDVLVGIFTGSGRAFCTGADLRGEHFSIKMEQCENYLSDFRSDRSNASSDFEKNGSRPLRTRKESCHQPASAASPLDMAENPF